MVSVNVTQKGVVKYPKHKHGQWEIMYYLSGEGYMYTKKANIPFTVGTIIAIPPNTLHGSVSKSGFINISVGGEFDGVFMNNEVIVMQDSDKREGKKLAELLYACGATDSYYKESLARAYALFILQRVEHGDSVYESVEKVIAEIGERAYDCDMRLSEILAKSGYAEDYIRSKFKQVTGTYPSAFLRKLRIDKAKYLIDIYGRNQPLCDIAEACGYLDYAYFSKHFKQLTGVSPKRYLSR